MTFKIGFKKLRSFKDKFNFKTKELISCNNKI